MSVPFAKLLASFQLQPPSQLQMVSQRSHLMNWIAHFAQSGFWQGPKFASTAARKCVSRLQDKNISAEVELSELGGQIPINSIAMHLIAVCTRLARRRRAV